MRRAALIVVGLTLLSGSVPVPSPLASDLPALTARAEEGDVEASFRLGLAHARGQGTATDPVAAVEWFRRAADRGHAGAQYYLGAAFDYGWGVPQDAEQAARWYLRAAEGGHSLAQLNLAISYETGDGVPRDPAAAAHWFRAAAEQGEPLAQYNLGLAYRDGHGIPADLVEALKWLTVAAARPSAQTEAEAEAAGARDDLAARLPPERVEEARRRATEWLDRRGGGRR